MGIWSDGMMVEAFLQEWMEAHSSLETSVVESIARRFGLWRELEARLEEEGWL